MKKIKVLLCAAMSLMTLAGCAQKKETKMTDSTNQKILVTYFSATGTTGHAAMQLAEVMGADLHEIKPETAYTSADLDWHNPESRSSVEMKDLSSRPAITGRLDNMAEYNVVFVGFPIWWYTAPTIINTFIETYNLQGKTLVPFATSGGSTIQRSCEDLKKSYPGLSWKEGKLLNSPTKGKLEAWKKELGIFCGIGVIAQPKMEEAKKMIQDGKAECVLIKNDTIYARERGRGVNPLLMMYDEHKEAMLGATLVDKVIGRAAASIAICGKVEHVYGELMSEDAVEFLNNNGITTSYTTLVHRILNRKRDGLCPLEQSVEGIYDAGDALAALRKRIESLQTQPVKTE